MDTTRRRHQRLFRDYSAHRFRYVFRVTKVEHITAHRAHHPPTIVDAPPPTFPFTIPPFPPPTHTTHTQHETHHTHHTDITGTRVDTKRRRHRRLFCDYTALRFAVYFGPPNVHTSQHIGPNTDTPLSTRSHHPPTPHMQHETHHTPHTHTHNRYLGRHQATKAPTSISRLFDP